MAATTERDRVIFRLKVKQHQAQKEGADAFTLERIRLAIREAEDKTFGMSLAEIDPDHPKGIAA